MIAVNEKSKGKYQIQIFLFVDKDLSIKIDFQKRKSGILMEV